MNLAAPTEDDYARIEERRGPTIRGTVEYYGLSYPAIITDEDKIWHWDKGRWNRSLMLTKKHFTPVGTTS